MPVTWIDDYFDACNRRDWLRAGEFWAEDALQERFGLNLVLRGREAIDEDHKNIVLEMPDWHLECKSFQQSGDRFALEFVASGTRAEESTPSGTPTARQPSQIRVAAFGELAPDRKIQQARLYFTSSTP